MLILPAPNPPPLATATGGGGILSDAAASAAAGQEANNDESYNSNRNRLGSLRMVIGGGDLILDHVVVEKWSYPAHQNESTSTKASTTTSMMSMMMDVDGPTAPVNNNNSANNIPTNLHSSNTTNPAASPSSTTLINSIYVFGTPASNHPGASQPDMMGSLPGIAKKQENLPPLFWFVLPGSIMLEQASFSEPHEAVGSFQLTPSNAHIPLYLSGMSEDLWQSIQAELATPPAKLLGKLSSAAADAAASVTLSAQPPLMHPRPRVFLSTTDIAPLQAVPPWALRPRPPSPPPPTASSATGTQPPHHQQSAQSAGHQTSAQYQQQGSKSRNPEVHVDKMPKRSHTQSASAVFPETTQHQQQQQQQQQYQSSNQHNASSHHSQHQQYAAGQANKPTLSNSPLANVKSSSQSNASPVAVYHGAELGSSNHASRGISSEHHIEGSMQNDVPSNAELTPKQQHHTASSNAQSVHTANTSGAGGGGGAGNNSKTPNKSSASHRRASAAAAAAAQAAAAAALSNGGGGGGNSNTGATNLSPSTAKGRSSAAAANAAASSSHATDSKATPPPPAVITPTASESAANASPAGGNAGTSATAGTAPATAAATTTAAAAASAGTTSSGVKRCTNCGTTTTPMWRKGPLGAGSLCNACGVKWRQGKTLVGKLQSIV